MKSDRRLDDARKYRVSLPRKYIINTRALPSMKTQADVTFHSKPKTKVKIIILRSSLLPSSLGRLELFCEKSLARSFFPRGHAFSLSLQIFVMRLPQTCFSRLLRLTNTILASIQRRAAFHRDTAGGKRFFEPLPANESIPVFSKRTINSSLGSLDLLANRVTRLFIKTYHGVFEKSGNTRRTKIKRGKRRLIKIGKFSTVQGTATRLTNSS